MPGANAWAADVTWGAVATGAWGSLDATQWGTLRPLAGGASHVAERRLGLDVRRR